MLILADSDGFRINLYKFCQWVLHTSCDRCGTSLSHVKIRKLFRSQLTCRIYRSTGFICDNILYLFFRDFFEHIYDHLLGFTACSTVSYGNQRNTILLDHALYGIFGSTDLLLGCRSCRVNNSSIQHFTCGIYNCQLTSGTERRVPSQYHFSCDWRLHQKLFQVLSKYVDCTVFCLICEVTADLTLDRRSDQTLVAVLYHCF